MYTPQNLAIFTAAYSGALAGMESGRVLTNPSVANYTGLASIAGAFAQELDTQRGPALASDLEKQTISELSEATWAGRTPQPVAPFFTPSTYLGMVTALLAANTASKNYYLAQGIPTSFDEESVPNLAALSAISDEAVQDESTVFVLTLLQSFELSKTSVAVVDGISVVATLSGVGRWLRIITAVPQWTLQTTWGVDYTGAGNNENSGTDSAGNRLASLAEVCRRLVRINFTNYTINIIGNIPATDAFRFASDTATEPSAFGVANANININGIRTPLVTSAMTAATATVGNVQATITDAAVVWATFIGKLIVVTSGASVGAVASVLKDLGAGVARVSQWWNTTTGVVVAAPAAGDTYTINDRTLCPMTFTSADMPNRVIAAFKDIDFTGVFVVKSSQVLLTTTRHSGPGGASGSLSIREGAVITANGCCVHFPVGATISLFPSGLLLASGCAFINVLQKMNDDGDLRLFQCVMQASQIIVGIVLPDFSTVQIGALGKLYAFGLGIFDSPAGTNALVIQRNGIGVIGASLYGSGNALFGAVALEGGVLMIRTTITPTITGASGDIQLEGVATAMPALEPSAGLVLPALSALGTWANWTAGPFSRNAMSYKTGARISDMTGPG